VGIVSLAAMGVTEQLHAAYGVNRFKEREGFVHKMLAYGRRMFVNCKGRVRAKATVSPYMLFVHIDRFCHLEGLKDCKYETGNWNYFNLARTAK